MTLLKPYLQQQFIGQIWKMLIDPVKELLFVEVRNIESREVSFSGFDLNTGEPTFMNYVAEEKWLTGMEGCFNSVLFLHGYESAQSPVHKAITAIDGANGKILWSNYNYAIQQISQNGPIAYHFQIQPLKLLLLNAKNGEVLRGYDAAVDVDMNQNINIPLIVETLDNDFKAHIKGEVVGNIHYIEHNSFRIVSLHTLVKTDLSQILLVLQGEKLVYEDLLIDEIQKLQPEAFIIQQNRLIYIKNKVELKVLNL